VKFSKVIAQRSEIQNDQTDRELSGVLIWNLQIKNQTHNKVSNYFLILFGSQVVPKNEICSCSSYCANH
jgi:hypothetical protein